MAMEAEAVRRSIGEGIEVKEETIAKIPFRRTLILGLGGTGVDAALRLKKEFQEHFGKVPPIVQIRCFDTNPDSRTSFLLDKNGDRVELTDEEYVLLEVDDPIDALETSKAIQDWAPIDKMDIPEIVVAKSAVQRRTSGRLAFYVNAEEIYSLIKEAIKKVKDMKVKDLVAIDPRFTLSEDERVNIYIVCSLAGGTGSGIMLDVAHFCRDILSMRDRRVSGLFLLPGIFEPRAGTHLIRGNTYAAAKELDYWLNIHQEEESITYGEAHKVRWGGGRKDPIFNHIYIIDNENLKGDTLNDEEMLKEFLGRALFLSATFLPSTGKAQDLLDTIASQPTMKLAWNGKYPSYLGLGLARLRLPTKEIIELKVNEATLSLIKTLLSPEEMDLREKADQFLKSRRLTRESILADLLPPEIPVVKLSEPYKEVDPKRAIEEWKEKEIRRLEAGYTKAAEENRRTKLEGVKQELAKALEDALNQQHAIDHATTFCNLLLSSLRVSRSAFEGKRASAEAARGTLSYPTEELERSARVVFGRRRQLRNVRDLYLAALKKEGLLIREIAGLREAERLLTELIDQIEGFHSKVTGEKGLRVALEGIAREIEMDLPKKSIEKSEDVFSWNLGEEYLKDEIEKIEAGATIAVLLQKENLLDWLGLDIDGIKRKFNQFLRPKFEELKGISIGQAIAAFKDRKILQEDLRNFVGKAIPMWNHKKHPDRKTESFIIFAIPYGEKRGSLEEAFGRAGVRIPAKEIQYAVTGDRFQWYALLCEASVPLYALKGMPDFKRAYEASEGIDTTFHLHKDWVGPEALPDLFPERPEEEVEEMMMYWAVAFADPPFSIDGERFLWADGAENYYIHVFEEEAVEKGIKEVKLAKGRMKAFEELKKNEKLYQGLKQAIDRVILEKGAAMVAQQLEEYRARLEERAKRIIDPKLKGFIGEELRLIKKFAENIW
jgi:hypothetical protein